jgi:hypothetical protein
MSNTILYVIIGISIFIILYILKENYKENYKDDESCSTITIKYLEDVKNDTFNANWRGTGNYMPCNSNEAQWNAAGDYLPNDAGTSFRVKAGSKFQYGPMGTYSSPINIDSVEASADLNYLAVGTLDRCTGECNDWRNPHILDGAQAIKCDGERECAGDLTQGVLNKIGSKFRTCSCTDIGSLFSGI